MAADGILLRLAVPGAMGSIDTLVKAHHSVVYLWIGLRASRIMRGAMMPSPADVVELVDTLS